MGACSASPVLLHHYHVPGYTADDDHTVNDQHTDYYTDCNHYLQVDSMIALEEGIVVGHNHPVHTVDKLVVAVVGAAVAVSVIWILPVRQLKRLDLDFS